MKITSAEFVISAVKKTQYPKDGLPEAVLIGRSNVGKSSLINTLVNRIRLAKTSSVPGKTQTINFYRINGAFYLVDLPGFGYAKVPVEVKRSWERMIEEYISGRPCLKAAVVILDPRRETGQVEAGLYEWLEGHGIPVLTVLTKADKLSKNEIFSKAARMKKNVPTIVDPVLFSAATGQGKAALGKRLLELLFGEVGGA